MPTAAKPLDNLQKHLTKAEREARERAEDDVMPNRGGLAEKPPRHIKTDAAARRYWREVIRRMDGLDILDSLDAEILAVYCTMLSRRDAGMALYAALSEELKACKATDKITLDALAYAASKLAALLRDLQGQERVILQYADKLGLTPSGRAQLARKRAAAEEPDPDADLFGA